MADEVHVHQTPPSRSGDGGTGWVLGLLVVIVLAVVLWLFFVRGGPSDAGPAEVDVDVNVPTQPEGGN